MDKKINLSVLEENFEHRSKKFEQIINSDYYFKNCRPSIWEYFQIKGWYELLITNKLQESKQAFYDAAKTDIHYYQTYTTKVSDLFSYGRTNVLETALSDNELVMDEYSNINYQINNHGRNLVWYTDMVNDGEGHIYCALISSAMTKNLVELKRLNNIVRTKCLKLKKNQWMNIDLNFFEGIVENDEIKVKETITQLCTKEHKSRNRHSSFFNDIVSHPAQGYLKIAWLNNMQIKIDNEFIHNEIIPVIPNKKYEDNVAELMTKMIIEEPPLNHNGQRIKQ